MGYPSVYPTGATLYDPSRAWSGYTLFQATEHGAVLVDMNGRVVREWPELHGFPNKILPGGAILGLMPEAAIERLLGPSLPKPSAARGMPRAELYVVVAEPATQHARALAAGAKELSPLSLRSWGHLVAYSLDPDGHVLAFATQAAASAV